jgi:molecular chaperone HscB
MDNYFELYDIPVSFRPDAALLKQKFYALSKQFHPDRFATADADVYAEALRNAALNNEAYKTLTDPDRTMAYILRLNGLLEEEEKYALPPAFLMEMMDLNELLSDYEDAADDATLKLKTESELAGHLQAWETDVAPLLQAFEGGDHSEAVLKQLKDFYFRKKYLLRIQERLTTFASR